MNDAQKTLVQQSFRQLTPVIDDVSAAFYQRLFELAPEVRDLFPADMTDQRRKLMYTLTLVVANLKNLEEVAPTIQALGQRHVGYGATPAHYAVVGEALIATLETGLGAGFTPEVKDAWTAAYGVIQGAMLGAS